MPQLTLKQRTSIFLDRHFSGGDMDYRRVIAIMIPVLIDQAFVVGLNLLNTAMVSSSGVAAVSAVNMVDSLNIFLINVFVAVSTGGTVVVAQFRGSGDEHQVSKAAAGSVASVFLLALIISLTLLAFHSQALGLLFGRAAPDVMQNARIYILGSSASYCGIAVEEAVCGALRGIGETRSSLALSIIMNFSYVILNLLFINMLHMGVMGLCLSVNISRYAAAICAIVYLCRFNSSFSIKITDLLHFNPSMLKKILFIGLPFAAEQMFFNGGKLLTQTFIVGLGTYAIAINAICGSIALLMQVPANAICLTIVTVVGQCIGAGSIADARKFIRSFLWASSASFAVMGLIILPLFNPIVSLFSPPAQIVPTVFTILIINIIFQIPLWSISFVLPSALRAAGDAKFTSVVAMLSMWLFRVVLGYILGVTLRFGILGVWLAMEMEWSIRGTVFLFRLHGEKWHRYNLINR